MVMFSYNQNDYLVQGLYFSYEIYSQYLFSVIGYIFSSMHNKLYVDLIEI